MDKQLLCTNIKTPKLEAYTFPAGPAGKDGRGITEVLGGTNYFTIKFSDGTSQVVEIPGWWFGTRKEFNETPSDELRKYALHFVLEGS